MQSSLQLLQQPLYSCTECIVGRRVAAIGFNNRCTFYSLRVFTIYECSIFLFAVLSVLSVDKFCEDRPLLLRLLIFLTNEQADNDYLFIYYTRGAQ